MIVKKYSNRRLYDTEQSRYITLDDLAQRVKEGAEPQVVDAKTGADLTQATLTQIILESRGAGKLLPVPLLLQLIRMGDEDLAQFLGRYMSWALEVYLSARRGAQAVSPYVPFANLPFQATSALARMWGGFGPPPPPPVEPAPPPEEAGDERESELTALRREIEELKKQVRGRKKR